MTRANLQKQIALTQERLKSILHYDPLTGIFTNRAPRRGATVGATAGTYRADGYLLITVDRKRYLGHRLAVLYTTGEWPIDQVDHIDLDPSNNSWGNLRECSGPQNSQNVPLSRRNTSGYIGVSWDRRRKLWKAIIGINNKRVDLGRFATAEEASAAYVAAKARLHTFNPTVR